MGQHSKYTDGKVLRAKGLQLLLPDLMLLLHGLEDGSHNLDDLRRLEAVRNKINDALETEATAFYVEYTGAANAVDMEVAEKNIVNGMAVMMLRELALRPVVTRPEHAQAHAPDVYLSATDWAWVQRRWKARDNLSGAPESATRTLRIADVLDGALGYKNMPDKTVAIEGESNDVGERNAT